MTPLLKIGLKKLKVFHLSLILKQVLHQRCINNLAIIMTRISKK